MLGSLITAGVFREALPRSSGTGVFRTPFFLIVLPHTSLSALGVDRKII
jgi:hypothetical protein